MGDELCVLPELNGSINGSISGETDRPKNTFFILAFFIRTMVSLIIVTFEPFVFSQQLLFEVLINGWFYVLYIMLAGKCIYISTWL